MLNYFRRKSSTLLESSGTFSNLILLHPIAAVANEEVSNLVHMMQSSQPKKHLRRTKKSNVYSSQLRVVMAALKHLELAGIFSQAQYENKQKQHVRVICYSSM